MKKVNLVIVGGGPAGLAAAKSAYDCVLPTNRIAKTILRL